MSNAMPPGQGPIDPRDAFAPPPPPGGAPGPIPPPPTWRGPGGWSPPPMGPPAMMGGFPPPRRKRRIGLALLIVALVISILINFVKLGSSMEANTSEVRSGGADKVAIIPVNELITDETAATFDNDLQAVVADKNVKAIVLSVDTPGGSASASDQMAHELDQFRASIKSDRPNFPIIVSMGGMATSGGYYVSCGADYIFARHTTLTANIGVIMPNLNFSKLMDKYGIQDSTIVSTGSTYKEAGSPTIAESDQDKAYLQGLCDSMDKQFIAVVKAGRGAHLNGPDNVLFNAKAYTGDEALQLGLVDKIGYEADAIDYAITAASLTNPTVYRFVPEPYLAKLLTGSKSSVPMPQSTSVTINGINIDERTIVDLLSPRPMYLWMGR
jgi:protease-4